MDSRFLRAVGVTRPARHSARLFLYGTLCDPALLQSFARRPVATLPASLSGWRRVALPDTRYPTLRRARGTVEGLLAWIDRPTLARLRAYEGALYRLVPVRVRAGWRWIPAQAWIARGGTNRAWPAPPLT